jgi:hypothetical protein
MGRDTKMVSAAARLMASKWKMVADVVEGDACVWVPLSMD